MNIIEVPEAAAAALAFVAFNGLVEISRAGETHLLLLQRKEIFRIPERRKKSVKHCKQYYYELEEDKSDTLLRDDVKRSHRNNVLHRPSVKYKGEKDFHNIRRNPQGQPANRYISSLDLLLLTELKVCH